VFEPQERGGRTAGLAHACRQIGATVLNRPGPFAANRLNFLSSRRGSLGNRSPLQILDDDDDFKRLRQATAAWAAEWSRTAVTMYEGEHETEPKDVEPVYAATAEIDPRRRLWERAPEAFHVHGYEWPLCPYPEVRRFTLSVERQTAGDSTPIPEACLQISVRGELISVRIKAAPGTRSSQKQCLPVSTRALLTLRSESSPISQNDSTCTRRFPSRRDPSFAGGATNEVCRPSY
jgi:hypothetical protein